MEKIKVIFRKEKNPYTKKWNVVAFFPELTATYGKIVTYRHIGQHSEGYLDWYWETKKVTEEEYKPLLDELNGIYDDCILVVKQKMNYNDLRNKAWKY